VTISKVDLTTVKMDIFATATKMGAVEYRNTGLTTETAGAKSLLTGLFTII
jgi:type VI secretion system secreted protein VgrG